MSVVSDWFSDLARSWTDSLANTRVDIVEQLFKASLPTPEQLASPVYLLGLGGGYGLANRFILMVIVILGAAMILTPMGNHGVKARQLVQSVIGVGIYGFVFFPIYSLAFNLVKGGVQAMINLATGTQNQSINEAAETMLDIVLPADVWFKLLVAGIALLITFFAYIIAWTNYLLAVFNAIFYTVPLALRPLGPKFNMLFHGANSAVATTLVAPLIMTFGLLIPAMAERLIPGVGTTGISSGIFTIIGSLIAFLGPLVFAFYAFKGSSQVFGRLDVASISGSVGIDSMPPVNSREMGDSVKESGLKAFASSVLPGAAAASLSKSDNLLGDVVKLGVEGVATAAAATGHPVAAGVLNAVDTTLSKEKRTHAKEAAATQSVPPLPQGPPRGVGTQSISSSTVPPSSGKAPETAVPTTISSASSPEVASSDVNPAPDSSDE